MRTVRFIQGLWRMELLRVILGGGAFADSWNRRFEEVPQRQWTWKPPTHDFDSDLELTDGVLPETQYNAGQYKE